MRLLQDDEYRVHVSGTAAYQVRHKGVERVCVKKQLECGNWSQGGLFIYSVGFWWWNVTPQWRLEIGGGEAVRSARNGRLWQAVESADPG